MSESWETHYRHFEGKKIPAAATLSKALALFDEEQYPLQSRHAIDLGCGSGIDTQAMIQQGCQVLAIDQQEEVLHQLYDNIPTHKKNSLTTLCRSFEDLSELPESTLVNASFSLPFCKPEKFHRLWQLIVDCLLPGGRFAGHFFGVEDSWRDNPDMTFHQSFEVQQLFSGFTIETLKEINKDGKTVSGKDKHWHVFHIVARKNLV
ncbi:class I SAM-dependent methyltransferase [Fulvivirgaceae bacterium BMA12]|uniref:Class I SAM-dependent methyltransferase n=1 Tax=Agaribacillus aureus TaxID=3051825 RepID=A0ABT8L038_9BACT|nr:class I SAM-dependent methyltransferase [Fulvivirgaceae bacterium BMA12]